MVQNSPRWRTSYAMGQPKQRKFKFDLMKSLWLDLLSSIVDSVPCDRCKGPIKYKYSFRTVSYALGRHYH